MSQDGNSNFFSDEFSLCGSNVWLTIYKRYFPPLFYFCLAGAEGDLCDGSMDVKMNRAMNASKHEASNYGCAAIGAI